MPNKDKTAIDAALFSYVVASADLRYIEVGERGVYLRWDPELGLIVRGEMTSVGPGHYANLSRILLEYALTCEGCKDHETAAQSAGLFGVRLGRILAVELCQDPTRTAVKDSVNQVFDIILNSMGVPCQKEHALDRLHYKFDEGPLINEAKKTGFSRGISLAHRSFVNLCRTILRVLAPDWVLYEPSERQTENPILEVILAPSRN